ncbi:lipid II flippase Amj family protein [Asticcacaulis sp. W401b]|uniref:lipid II flippase Amj family protein n=1 Tax=Asticcacaulis sp. W401b TaxID=3388666 RepID=UPI003970C49C
MDIDLIALCALTLVIQMIGTLAYAVRIAGIRTRRIAVSFALFNVLVLVSRTSNSFQGPYLGKRIEVALSTGISDTLLGDFRWLITAALIGTVAGVLAIPTFQRIFSRAVQHFQVHRSVPKLLMHGFAKGGLSFLRDSVTVPALSHLTKGGRPTSLPHSALLLNILAQALFTVGVFASLYAGAISPDYRVTASQLSSVVNGLATILLFVFIDPQLSIMTDDVMEGRTSESEFRKAVVWLAGARLIGTALAQVLLVPAATLIAVIAVHL